MDPSLFKPIQYDPYIFIDPEQAKQNVLDAHGLSDQSIDSLPLSAFVKHSRKADDLNIYTLKSAARNLMGNKLIYVSGGETTSQYTSGVLVQPDFPQRNLLNRYRPAITISQTNNNITRSQLGGLKLPQNVAVLTYININPRPILLTERIEPGKLYILPDPSLYGNGHGTDDMNRHALFDYEDNVSWIRSHPVVIGRSGGMSHTSKLPLFYNYTSFEQSNTVPKYGLSKFTDNFDFFNGSTTGDQWSNSDIYNLPEANKFDINDRQDDLLVDICDSPYQWKTDIYGNQFMLYKVGPKAPKKTAGGSDTDGDGVDDRFESGVGEPDYGNYDGGIDGVYSGDSSGEIDFGDNIGVDKGSEPFDPGTGECPPCIENGQSRIPGRDADGNCLPCSTGQDDVTVDPTKSQLPLAECKYFLYGGDSLSPTNSANNLDMTYRFSTRNTTAARAYTTAGAVSAITDGGWRCVRNDQDDQTENQFELTMAGGSVNLNSLNGFFDLSYFNAQKSSFNPDDQTKIGWLPNYTRRVFSDETQNETHMYPLLEYEDQSNLVGGNYKYTFVFSKYVQSRFQDSQNSWTLQFDRAYSQLLPDSQRRSEAAVQIPYTLADGGWIDFGASWDADIFSFFRTQCDRASYILSLYGLSGKPDFGEHLFACKMFDITNDPEKWMEMSKTAAYGEDDDLVTDPRTGETRTNPNSYAAELAYARYRGPLNALTLRNPIEWSESVEGKFQRNIQFWGTKTMLERYLASVGKLALLSMFDYLTRGEFVWMRISPIDGVGNQKVHEEDSEDVEAAFFDLSQEFPASPSTIAKQYGSPDIMYYVEGGDIDFVDAPFTTTYDQASSFMSYIAPPLGEIIIPDWQDNASQFPQVPHDVVYDRSYQISLDTYNNLNCTNVSEYRQYRQTKAVDPAAPPEIGDLTTNWTVKQYHPIEEFRDKTFRAKRGYFPPPVGHLKRYKGEIDGQFFGQPAESSVLDPRLTENQLDMIGADKPINDNLMPLSAAGEFPEEIGFYVHDIWDGSGFLFQLGADESSFTDEPPPGENKGPPPATNPTDPIDCPTNDCDDLPPIDDVIPGPGGPGGDDRDIKLDRGCGSYTGYNSPTLSASPCGGKDVPLESIGRVVKRSSDSFSDTCAMPEHVSTPTLWEAKHLYANGSFQYPSLTANNIYIRGMYNDRVKTMSSLLSGLSAYSEQEGGVLSTTIGFIDIDVINDILILRQSPTTNDDTQTYLIDKMQFNYETGDIQLGQFMTKHIQSDLSNNSQLMTHYYNEADNTIIMCVTRDRTAEHKNWIVPEIYQLNLNDEKWSRIFPEHENAPWLHRLRPYDLSDYDITRIDPGEISYNPTTNTYSITYFAEISNGSYIPTMAIFVHRFENTEGYLTYIDTELFHSENKEISSDTSTSMTDKQDVELDIEDTSDNAIQTTSPSLVLRLNPDKLRGIPGNRNSNVFPLKMKITWGDGESSVIYSDIFNRGGGYFHRYGSSADRRFRLSDNTVLITGATPDSGTISLTRHRIEHTYNFDSEQPLEVNITTVESDNQTSFSKKITIEPELPEISSGINNIKLLNARLYSKPGVDDKQYMLLTMEVQTDRHVVNNK